MDGLKAAGQVPGEMTAAGSELNDVLLLERHPAWSAGVSRAAGFGKVGQRRQLDGAALLGRRPASKRMPIKVGRKASNAEHPSQSKMAGAQRRTES